MQGKNNHKYFLDIQAEGFNFGRLSTATTEITDMARAQCLKLVNNQSNYLSLKRKSPKSRDELLAGIEAQLQKLSRQGVLASSEIVFGLHEDPFHPFEGRFDTTLKVLKLLEKYQPGHLLFQTRSSLIVIAIGSLKAFGNKLTVSMPIETSQQASQDRYCADLPRISDRLHAMRTLRSFGIHVVCYVSTILPYGDWKKDARAFAKILHEHADHISIHALTHADERNLRTHPVALRLAEARQFHYLRPDAAQPVLDALKEICPEKVEPYVPEALKERQLSIFAA